jgi:hypothetical protein
LSDYAWIAVHVGAGFKPALLRPLAGAARRTSRHDFGVVARWNVVAKGLPMADGEFEDD